jgi:EF-hand domain pair
MVLSADEIARLRDLFDEFDKDRGGTIDADELKHVIEMMGFAPTQDELESMILAVDESGSGSITFAGDHSVQISLYHEAKMAHLFSLKRFPSSRMHVRTDNRLIQLSTPTACITSDFLKLIDHQKLVAIQVRF